MPSGVATGRLVRDDAAVEGVRGGSVDAEALRTAEEDEDGDGRGAGDVAVDSCRSMKVLSSCDSDVTALNSCMAAAVAAGVGSGHGCAWATAYADPGTRNGGQPGRDALRCLIQVDGAGGDAGETGSDLSRSAFGGSAGSSGQSGMSTGEATSNSAALGSVSPDAAEISTWFGLAGGAGLFFWSISLFFGSESRSRRRLPAAKPSFARLSGCRLQGPPQRSVNPMPPLWVKRMIDRQLIGRVTG